MRFKAVFFDVDGTILNSDRAIVTCWNDTFKAHRMPTLPPREIMVWAGLRAYDWMHGLFPSKPKGVLLSLSNEAESRYANYCMPHLARLMPGTKQVLSSLRRAGVKTAIITNMTRPTFRAMLKDFGIHQHFDALVTVENARRPKPAPDPLFAAAKMTRVKPWDAMYVGDTRYDVLSARAAGMKVAMLNHPRNRAVKSDYRLRDLRDLLKLVR